MKTFYYLLLLLITISCSSPTQRPTLKFTKEEYPGKWPFSVNEIEVYCSGYKEIYCEASNGKVYTLMVLQREFQIIILL
ncbi:hypothetical protein [Chryseobacterium jejuense]|uniref:hypothetical protein n=1 Tax=Chryseobacterium jejuense TaxID=445960 RepID=UPI001E295A22|nr:hypothetical protein [Chryseobacterium jejuense]